jgi:hypothetical protein
LKYSFVTKEEILRISLGGKRMKKLLVLLLAMGIIAGLSSMVYAVPNSITVTCDYANGQDCSVGESIFFAAGTYQFAVVSGAWGTWDVGWTGVADPNLSKRGYLWSLYIEVPGNPVPFKLGDDSFNGEGNTGDGVFLPVDAGNPADVEFAKNAALNNALTKNPYTIITVGGAGENLRFYMNDPYPRENNGSVTLAVVPEPVSSTLFVLGGAVFAGRRFWKKRSKS